MSSESHESGECSTPKMMDPSLGEVWIEFVQRRFNEGYGFERMILIVQEDLHKVVTLDLFTGTLVQEYLVAGFGRKWEKMV